jgi:polar amino acid transport system substrate-binding protein
MVGFNRRFSPLTLQLKKELGKDRWVITYRINAGQIPASHWHQDADQGGGRIVGEVCHFIDAMQYLTMAEPIEVYAVALLENEQLPVDPDSVNISIRFSDGSVGSIAYISNGDPSFPKERLEVFSGGRVGVIDNWRSLRVQGNGSRLSRKCWVQAEKGHSQEIAAFIQSIRRGQSAIGFDSMIATTKATFAVQKSLRSGLPVSLRDKESVNSEYTNEP